MKGWLNREMPNEILCYEDETLRYEMLKLHMEGNKHINI